MIISIVFIVGFVGFLTVMPHSADTTTSGQSNSPTGNVVLEQQSNCGACNGDPVCAVKDTKAYNYPSACAASCDGARVLYGDVCERIPHASK